MNKTIKFIGMIVLPLIFVLSYPHIINYVFYTGGQPFIYTIYSVLNFLAILGCILISRDVKYTRVIASIYMFLFGSHIFVLIPIHPKIQMFFYYITLFFGKSRSIQLMWLAGFCVMFMLSFFTQRNKNFKLISGEYDKKF